MGASKISINKYCIYQYPRMKNKKPYFYCKLKRKEITYADCKKCQKREIKQNKPIRKKTNKLAKKERKRYSILQLDTEMCYLCHRQLDLDKHEAFSGSNRQKSIEWGLIYYLCRICHIRADIDETIRQQLHDYARETFIEKYSEELFLKEFKKMYKKGNVEDE